MYKFISSPNWSERSSKINAIVLHHTDMSDAQTAIRFLCQESNQVSSHYVVGKDGKIVQLVKDEHKAWHAGKSCWKGRDNVNDYSIGIEIDNNGYNKFPDVQMEAVKNLCVDLITRYNVQQDMVLAHSDIAPGRKFDPHPLFDWKYLFSNNVGLFSDIGGEADVMFSYLDKSEEILVIRQALKDYGYNITVNDVFDSEMLHVVVAFHRHFCPDFFDDNLFDKWTIRSNLVLKELIKLQSQCIAV